MSKVYNIPINYKEGIYSIKDLNQNIENVIRLDYEEFGDIVTYQVLDYEDHRQVTLYGIPKDKLENTLKATYSGDGHLKKITVNIENRDILMYIHYENMEASRQEIQNFAIENADFIIEKICMCKEVVSRLLIEYFNDGEYIDFHAKIGTEAQKRELEKKYPDEKDIADYCGNWSSEFIDGDNDKLKIMILCANNEKMDFFRFAVDIMAKRIEKRAVEQLSKADDFKFLCTEYD